MALQESSSMEIHLRELRDCDAEGMLEWMTDPNITCFFRFDATSMTLEKCKNFIQAANKEINCRHYAIADQEDIYLGTISLKEINVKDGSAEYAISTRSCAHGTGAAMQATKEMIRIAFEDLGLNRVYLNVLTDNLRANAFYKKAGFQFERKEEDALEIRGISKSLNWYAITKQK